jgi:hypothetical protein
MSASSGRTDLRSAFREVVMWLPIILRAQRAFAGMQILQLLSRSLEISGPIFSRGIRPCLSSVFNNAARCPNGNDGPKDGGYGSRQSNGSHGCIPG